MNDGQCPDPELESLLNGLELIFDQAQADLKQAIAEWRNSIIRWVVAVALLQSILIVGVLMKVAKLI